jgi:hypothetical protein
MHCCKFITIRLYYHFLPVEQALMLGGIILFTIVYYAINKLENRCIGITFKEDKSCITLAFDAMKAILINANVEAISTSAEKAPMEFAGGGFSGGSL